MTHRSLLNAPRTFCGMAALLLALGLPRFVHEWGDSDALLAWGFCLAPAVAYAVGAFLLARPAGWLTRKRAFAAVLLCGLLPPWWGVAFDDDPFTSTHWLWWVGGLLVLALLSGVLADELTGREPAASASMPWLRRIPAWPLMLAGAVLILASLALPTSDGTADGWRLWQPGWSWVTADSYAGSELRLFGHDVGDGVFNWAGRIIYGLALLMAIAGASLALLYRGHVPQPRQRLLRALARLAVAIGVFVTVDLFFGWYNFLFHDATALRWVFLPVWLAAWLAPVVLTLVPRWRPLLTAHRSAWLWAYLPLMLMELWALSIFPLDLYGYMSFVPGAQLLALGSLRWMRISAASGIHDQEAAAA